MKNNFKIHDISMEISEDMIVYKNREGKKPQLIVTRDFDKGSIHESIIKMDLHTGTHIDAPYHVMEGGRTIDKEDLSKLIVSCRVLDLTDVKSNISSKDLINKDINEGDFILLKTQNSYDKDFNFDFIYLDKDGAKYLKDKGVIGVGIDGLGIERDQANHESHQILLGNNIPIIEGLALKNIEEGLYTLIALPLKIKEGEASPLRAVLLEEI